MRRLFKRFFITLGITAFLLTIWANRTGRLKLEMFDWGGTLTPVTDATPWKPNTVPVRLGIFAENVYDFNVTTQSLAAEGLVWIVWGQAFQELLDSEGVTVEQIIHPVNRVNSWDYLAKPFYPKPLRTEEGDYYQLIRFAGRFYVDKLDLHRYPFERIVFPIAFGLNVMSDMFCAEKVRLIADTPQSGVGPFVDIIGYATDSFKVKEYIQVFPTSFGYRKSGSKTTSDFSQIRLEIEYKKSALASIQQLILPLLIVMVMTLVAPSLAASLWDVRIAIPSTALLTLVFLQQGYRQNLPFLPYVTYLDQIYGACYISTFALFCLFVWASNKLNSATEEERPAVIARLNDVDFYFQVACIGFLTLTITLNWLFPVET
jgi:hypothetical protein